MDNLPKRIVKMISLLHKKGFQDIYIYSGMSPSGMNWRFTIGHLKNETWPNKTIIVQGSVRAEGDVEWANENSCAEDLCKNFISFYKLTKSENNSTHLEYVIWYAKLVETLKESELLEFYADYEAPHEYLLTNAPGYKGKDS